MAASTRAVVEGKPAYERYNCVFLANEYVWTLATVFSWTAATDGGKLWVLDFGGSLDSTRLQNWARIRQFRGLD